MLISERPYLWGGVFGLLTIPLHLLVSKDQSVILASILMGVIAGVYIGFAAKQERFSIFAFEFIFAVLFAIAAFVGAVYSPVIIPIVYILHGFWDMIHHKGTLSGYTPSWYIPLCVIYDWILGAFFIIYWIISG